MSPSTVLVLGAGATVADVATRPLKHLPPLDRGFFHGARTTLPTYVAPVQQYMSTTYGRDILQHDNDSLEQVMSQVYIDMFNPYLRAQSTSTFRSLLRLFTSRLAGTTNSMDPNNKRWLYRILVALLTRGSEPKDVTIVTFNQDLQIEKTLALLSEVARWRRFSDALFNFPGCYGIGAPDVTGPRTGPTFAVRAPIENAVRVLKLHGSLNWYSSHTSRDPSPQAMFNPSRRLFITRRRVILPSMRRTRPRRAMYALPVIVPPVSHKSSVLHQTLQEVWRQAEEALRKAEELVIFGYSCPPLDFESSSLLRRSLRARRARINVIDPAAAAAARYIDLLEPKRLSYYPSPSEFLADFAATSEI